jgi:DNA helicase-2/ATP-dependent DNA helicase PcrA
VRAWDDDLDAPGDATATAAAASGETNAGSRSGAKPARPIIPGERQFRDGDRVRHARWGDGIVVTSKLTRSDEEVTVAFKDASVGRKTMLVSLANLDLVG